MYTLPPYDANASSSSGLRSASRGRRAFGKAIRQLRPVCCRLAAGKDALIATIEKQGHAGGGAGPELLEAFLRFGTADEGGEFYTVDQRAANATAKRVKSWSASRGTTSRYRCRYTGG